MGSGFYVLPSIAGGSAHATLVAAIGRARKDKRGILISFSYQCRPSASEKGKSVNWKPSFSIFECHFSAGAGAKIPIICRNSLFQQA